MGVLDLDTGGHRAQTSLPCLREKFCRLAAGDAALPIEFEHNSRVLTVIAGVVWGHLGSGRNWDPGP